ncbi:hypothetical protein MKEN_00958900 [Mycena kentingensis (nom. inval.)]|nr:hypothetical protein MKEN_00958900 [Mycena kentingensis (nom. inval.)]
MVKTQKRYRPPAAPVPGSASISFSFDEVDIPAELAPLNSFVDAVSDDGRRSIRHFHSLNPPSPVKATRREMHAQSLAIPLRFDAPALSNEEGGEGYTMALLDEDEEHAEGEEEEEEEEDGLTAALTDDPAKTTKATDHAMHEWSTGAPRRTSTVVAARNRARRSIDAQNAGASLFAGRAAALCTRSSHSIGSRNGTADSLSASPSNPLAFASNWATGIETLVLPPLLPIPTSLSSTSTASILSPSTSAAATSGRTRTMCSCLATAGKITAYDFYGTLEHLTDGSGVKPPDRYKPLLPASRERKRGSSLSDVRRVLAPTSNLPPDWTSAPPEMQCLYIMFIAIDACFRLKRRMISSWLRDPGLGTGWAYMVEWAAYRDWLASTGVQKEISTCTGLADLDHANSKFSRGYAATGVAMCICARHEFVLPNGVPSSFANIDYIFASILRHISVLLRLMISYDIACQWWKSLQARLRTLPPLIRLSVVFSMVRFVIPKMHIKAHTLACQLLFSLYLALGSGQTDGEGIERLWAMCGAVAASTKLSGPGARADQLDDHWSYWNWMKVVGLPALLRRRLDTAQRELAKQESAFTHFSAQQADRVPTWLTTVNAFEAPRTSDGPEPPNPYQATVNGLTEHEVRKKLKAQETQEFADGVPRMHDVTPVTFVTFGLDLEETQRKIRVQAELKRADSSTSKINLGDMRRDLNKSIQRLCTLRATYTPGALVQLATLNVGQAVLAEDVPLLLPSSLAPAHPVSCKNILAVEQSLREAQCRVALAELRNQLHIKARLLLYKKNHSRHQAQNISKPAAYFYLTLPSLCSFTIHYH